MDIIVQPNIHTYKSAFFMVMDYRSRGIPLWMAEILICTMCGCFGTTIYGIAVHFIYRLFALERQGRLRFFQERYLIFWFLLPIAGGALWFTVCFTLFSMDPLKTEYIRNTVKEFFDLEVDDCAYAGAAFYPNDKNGTRITSERSFMGFALFLIVMTIPFVVVIFAGGKSYLIIRALLKQGESRYSKNLQMQLYKALVAQTFIPILLLFIPFGIIFILPIFEIDCQFLSAPITFVYALYPAVDPLPILFFVDYYRIAVSNFFDSLRCKTARVGVYEEESSRSNNRERYPILWFLLSIAEGALWFTVCFTLFSMDPLKTETTVKEFFDLEVDDCAYAGAAFYPNDKNGTRITSERSFMGFALFLIVMTIPFLVVIFAGGKSYLIIRALLKQGESRYSKNLRMQLYKALVAQTFIPILLLFIPFGTIFILPIFEIDCQFLSAPITFVYALYPAVDPLPILFFVDYYRIAVSNFFDSLRCKTARVGVYEEESSRSNNRV